jgi:hypothetical protein
VFFKSCGFHIVEQRYEGKVTCLANGVQLSMRHRDDDDAGNLEKEAFFAPENLIAAEI